MGGSFRYAGPFFSGESFHGFQMRYRGITKCW
jgi:hypothetical protein